MWTSIADTRAGCYSSLGSIHRQLGAIGGKESHSIDAYNQKDCWYEFCLMAIGRTRPLVAQLKLVVAGRSSGKRDEVTLTVIITEGDVDKKCQYSVWTPFNLYIFGLNFVFYLFFSKMFVCQPSLKSTS